MTDPESMRYSHLCVALGEQDGCTAPAITGAPCCALPWHAALLHPCHWPSWRVPAPLLSAQVPAELRVQPAPHRTRLDVCQQHPFQFSNKQTLWNIKRSPRSSSCTKTCSINENNEASLVLTTQRISSSPCPAAPVSPCPSRVGIGLWSSNPV